MKTWSLFLFLIFTLSLAACSGQPTNVYTEVAPAVLKPGDPIPAPVGEVILTVSGKIGIKNSGDTLQLDMPTLEKFGVVEYAINDPWLKQKVTYQGVLMSEFLKIIQAEPGVETVHFVALDNYEVDLAVQEINKWPILLATRANGQYMSMSENGPTRIIFPFDQFPEIDPKIYRDLMIWNIASMEVR